MSWNGHYERTWSTDPLIPAALSGPIYTRMPVFNPPSKSFGLPKREGAGCNRRYLEQAGCSYALPSPAGDEASFLRPFTLITPGPGCEDALPGFQNMR